MRLAILDCDYLYDNLKQDYISYPHMFIKAFEASNQPISYEVFSAIDRQLPNITHEFDGWVIMGSKFGAYDDYPWIHELKAFIRQLYAAGEKLAGICFGHQIIHQSLGGKVQKAAVGWGVGVHDYQVLQRPQWLTCLAEDVPAHLSIIVSHQDQVVETAPGAQVLAGSTFCPNAICTINDQIFTCQAHPEFTAEYSRILMNIRRTCIGVEKVELAEMSLLKALDSRRVLQWLYQLFIQPRKVA
jgi:GMP synthase (glutamine-hydrolysing)